MQDLFKEIKENDKFTQSYIVVDHDDFIGMKKSKTSSVYYCNNSHCFCFFDIDEVNKLFYDIDVDLSINPAEAMLNALYKLSTKSWYNIDVQKDFLELFRYKIGEKQWNKISSYNS